MKRFALVAVIAIISVIFISWGVVGHRIVGGIAQNHLKPKTAKAIKELLGSETLADVSTWADEVRGQQAYKRMGSWHYINVPLGLSFDEFEKAVTSMSGDNVCAAVLKCEQEIMSDKTTKAQKAVALKFLVHFVGDLHQPMHVSRAEDKGGNTIQLNYEGKGTNLHALWDTDLLEHQGLSYEQLTEKYDHISPDKIKEWQKDSLIEWLWESYEISSKLYAEIDAMKGKKIDDAYYQSHIGIIEERVEKAGIRLAGLLNELFKDGVANSAVSQDDSNNEMTK